MSNTTVTPPERRDPKLRVGLIVDSEFVSKYVYDLAQWGQTQDDVVFSHLIIQKDGNARQRPIEDAIRPFAGTGFLDSIRIASFALITKFETFRMKGNKFYKDHLTRYSLKQFVPESITIAPIPSKTGPGYHYSVEDIQKVKNLGLDVLIQCIPGTFQGEILESSRFGIISLHYADNRVNRGGPPGFWEVYFKQENTGFIIQRLTETQDGGNVLIRGRFATGGYFLLNQAALYTKSNFHLKKLLTDIAAARALPAPVDPHPYFNPVYELPTLIEQLKYISDFGFSLPYKLINRLLLKQQYRWGVAYAKSDWKTLVMWRANKIRNPPNHFLADPFVIREGDRDYCFVEDCDYGNFRGSICVYELKEDSAERLGQAIAEPFHMSFPYLFRYESKLYMCPETSANGDIRLYEPVNFPLEWKHSRTLMSNVAATDTMIFEHGGLWWLFTNIDPTVTESHYSELFIFYADNPLSAEWHAHPKNPFLIDSAKGRNAGILFDDKWIYRVSQRQGFDLYGKGFSINRIAVLNQDEYVETEYCSVEPKFFPKLLGCHHLHSNGDISVFDYLRRARIDD